MHPPSLKGLQPSARAVPAIIAHSRPADKHACLRVIPEHWPRLECCALGPVIRPPGLHDAALRTVAFVLPIAQKTAPSAVPRAPTAFILASLGPGGHSLKDRKGTAT